MLILSLLIAVAQISSKLLRAPQYCVQLTYTLNAYCRTSQKALENRSRVLRKPFKSRILIRKVRMLATKFNYEEPFY